MDVKGGLKMDYEKTGRFLQELRKENGHLEICIHGSTGTTDIDSPSGCRCCLAGCPYTGGFSER